MTSDKVCDGQRAFVVAAHPAIRLIVAIFVVMMVVGVVSRGASVSDMFADAPLPIRIVGPVALLGVVASWLVYAVRLQTVLRVTVDTLRVERRYPPLYRTFGWQDIEEWKTRRTRGRGSSTLRIRFSDGHRVTIYPGAARNAASLVAALEATLPATGTSERVGRRPNTALSS
jgi:hypothetical protein